MFMKQEPSACQALRVYINLHSLLSLSPASFTFAASGVSWHIIYRYVVFLNSLSDTYKFILVVLFLLQEYCTWILCWLCASLSQQESAMTQWVLQVPYCEYILLFLPIGGGPCKACKQKRNHVLATRNDETNCLNDARSLGETDHVLALMSFLGSVKRKLYSIWNKKSLLPSLLITNDLYMLLNFLLFFYFALEGTKQVVMWSYTWYWGIPLLHSLPSVVWQIYITAAENAGITVTS